MVNRLGRPARGLRNDAPAAPVAVRLQGSPPNTQAVGARIRLLGGAIPLQVREVTAGGLYLSHSDYLASFAAGTSQRMQLVIDWRDGRETRLDDVRPNRLYEISDSTARAHPAGRETLPPLPLFADATAELRGHDHTEDSFDDWDRQYLLPDGLSELGPGLAWFDLDRDGYEDLLVGTGQGGRVAVFHNEHGKLVPAPAQGPAAPLDFTTLLGMSDGRTSRVLAGVSTWEARDPAKLMAQPAVIGWQAQGTSLAEPAEPLVPSHESAVGPLALGDYDGDGSLDLFVGGRALPLRYPEPASSGLFRNVAGRFVLDTANSALLNGIGMVSAALFADVDGDGWDDLLLAREWGSIVLFLNRQGHFVRAPDSWGFSRLTSRWNGLAAGDLDGDGRLDLIATSWGENLAANADSARPLLLYYGPFGAVGEEEMLLAREDPRLGGPGPLNRWERVRKAVPALAERITSFAAYADAGVDKLLGPFRGQVHRLEAASLASVAFLNRGDHFEAVPLPPEAQLAPAFYAGVADFDGDGNEDVFLAQNFSYTTVGVQRYDSGRGLLLLGDGKGGLAPVPGARSGLAIYGDQRGAAYADFDGDGRLDLAVSQNGAATRLFRNQGAKPGVRVRLQGAAGNPDGVGAQLRVVYGNRMGPVREIAAGSGYWSQNGAVQVFGLAATPTAIWVRWPGGQVTTTPVPPGAREITVRR